MEYKVLSDKEAKKFALDMNSGIVYTDRHLPPGDEISFQQVFMPITFADRELIDELRKDPPGMVFEYIKNAMPMACNGRPVFISMQFLSQESTELVDKYLTELEQWENEGEEEENDGA